MTDEYANLEEIEARYIEQGYSPVEAAEMAYRDCERQHADRLGDEIDHVYEMMRDQ